MHDSLSPPRAVLHLMHNTTAAQALTKHPGRGAPVLLLHGSTLDSRSFTDLIPHLGGRPLWIPDQRGHGLHAERSAYVWADLTEDLVALLRTAETPVDVIGVSLGGILGVELALSHPHLIRSVCLVGAAVDGENPATRERAETIMAALHAHDLEPLIPMVIQLFLGASGSDLRLARAVDEQVRNTGAIGVINGLAATIERPDLRPRLSALTLPLLCLWGEHDGAISAARCRDTAERLPGAAWAEIAGGNHLIANEFPDEIGRRICAWWAAHALV